MKLLSKSEMVGPNMSMIVNILFMSWLFDDINILLFVIKNLIVLVMVCLINIKQSMVMPMLILSIFRFI